MQNKKKYLYLLCLLDMENRYTYLSCYHTHLIPFHVMRCGVSVFWNFHFLPSNYGFMNTWMAYDAGTIWKDGDCGV